ncbi:MAG: hypothetical protein EPO21_08225 [Chloroflexota bacterium]|nr:MAG: hypothetical protein EPO21_08225 [Chloroflexota bacterium]
MIEVSARDGSADALLFEANIDIGPHFTFPHLKRACLTSSSLTVHTRIPLVIPLKSIESVRLRRWWLSERAIEIRYVDGVSRKLRFSVSNRLATDRRATQDFFQAIEAARGGTAAWKIPSGVFPAQLAPVYAQTVHQMRKEIGSWGKWLMGVGIVSLVLNNFLDPTWGIVLILAGLLSFKIKEPCLLIVYGCTLVWAAILNIASASPSVAGVMGVQLILAFTVFSRYPRYDRAFRKYAAAVVAEGQSTPMSPYAAHFPLASMLLGLGTLMALCGLILAVAFGIGPHIAQIGSVVDRLFALDFYFAAAAFTLGLAALLRDGGNRLQSAVGMGLGLTAIWIILFLTIAR